MCMWQTAHVHICHTQKAKNIIIYQCATISDEPVVLLDLSLTITYFSSWPLPSLLCIASLPGSEEGGGNQQMSPEHLNKVFLVKTKRRNLVNTIKNPMTPCFRRIKFNEVGSRFCGNRHTQICRQNDYHNPTAQAQSLVYGTIPIASYVQIEHTCTVFMLIERKLKNNYNFNFSSISGKGRHTLH